MSTPTTIADERLVQIVDHKVIAQDWEIPIIASELLARRARQRQEEEMRARMAKYEAQKHHD